MGASLSDTGASVAISSMSFLKQPTEGSAAAVSQQEQLLAVGDAQGYLHVLTIPKNLVKPVARERENMKRFLEREEARVNYFRGRQEELQVLKETMEKGAKDDAKEDERLEAEYQKLEAECIEELRLGGF